MKVRNTFWAILAVMLACWAAVKVLNPTQTGIFYRLIYLCILMLLVSFIWAMFSVRRFAVRRFARGLRQQLGQVFEERFEIENMAAFQRSWVDVRNESNLPGCGGSRVLSWLVKNEVRGYSAYTLLQERGQFLLGPTSLYAGDPFGIFAYRRRIPGGQSLLVLPLTVDLRTFPFPPGLLPGGRAKRLKTHEVTPHAASVREYAPGDSLNRIHWPTSVRKDHLMVKEFEQDPRADVWIFVDAQAGTQFSLEKANHPTQIDQFWLWQHKSERILPKDSFEYAVSSAASVAKYFLMRGQSLGFCSEGQFLVVHSAERGERQLSKILETLALLRCQGKMGLDAVVLGQLNHLPRGSTVILISAATDTSLVSASMSLAQRGVHPVVVYIDPVSFGGRNSILEHVASLQRRNVPVAVMTKESDLQEVLESGF